MKRRSFFLSPLALVGITTAAIAAPKSVGTTAVKLELDATPFIAACNAARDEIEARLAESQRIAAVETRVVLDELRRLIDAGRDEQAHAAEAQQEAAAANLRAMREPIRIYVRDPRHST